MQCHGLPAERPKAGRTKRREKNIERNERYFDGGVFNSAPGAEREGSDPLPPNPERHPQLGHSSPPLLQ